MDDGATPLDELRALTAATRALLEQLRASGANELPVSPATPAVPRSVAPVDVRSAPLRTAPDDRRPASSDPRPPTSEPSSAPAIPTTVLVPAAPRLVQAPADLEGRRLRLDVLRDEAAACVRCALHTSRSQTVFSRGRDLGSELMFVGEGPGAEEDAAGEPFVGASGQLLDKMIVAMGYRRDEVYIANVVKCRPPGNRKPEASECAACERFLHEQIALVRPKVIVALGATATLGLLQLSGITNLRGKWRLYRSEIPVMPTFHPAYVLRVPTSKRDVWSDLQQVMVRLGKSAQK